MTFRADKSRKTPQEGNPGAYSAGPPPHVGADHSFTLQAIMDLTKSMGQVVESVNGMSKRVDALSDRIEKLEEKVSSITHKLYAAGIVIAIAVTVGGFVINKASDLAVGVINKAATTIVEQAPAEQKAIKK
jgi:hypothetical protein